MLPGLPAGQSGAVIKKEDQIEEKKATYTELEPSTEIGQDSGFAHLEVGEQYKAHVAKVHRVEDTDFDGNPRSRICFGLQLDEGDGKGEVHGYYVTESLHEKANLTKFLRTVIGEPRKFKVEEVLGQPLRATFRMGKTEANSHKQYVDVIFPPAKDQKRVDVVKEPAQGLSQSEIEAVFPGAEEAS